MDPEDLHVHRVTLPTVYYNSTHLQVPPEPAAGGTATAAAATVAGCQWQLQRCACTGVPARVLAIVAASCMPAAQRRAHDQEDDLMP